VVKSFGFGSRTFVSKEHAAASRHITIAYTLTPKADKEWDKLFSESEDILEHLAQEALMEHEKGKTKNLDINKL
jgi:hypothetical protein